MTNEQIKQFKHRYCEAHKSNFSRVYPKAWSDGLYSPPVIPKWKTANGLTRFICNFLLWQEWRATRIASSGRLVDGTERTESGLLLSKKKWIPGTTRKGTADISATILGRAVMWEVKVGKDKPSEYQLKEAERERKAGGHYFFVHNPKEFFEQYDFVLSLFKN